MDKVWIYWEQRHSRHYSWGGADRLLSIEDDRYGLTQEWIFKYDKDRQLIEKFRGKTGFFSKKKDRWSQKQVIKNRCIMLKYFYNNEIGFLDVDPEFVDLGLKYALKKALEYWWKKEA